MIYYKLINIITISYGRGATCENFYLSSDYFLRILTFFLQRIQRKMSELQKKHVPLTQIFFSHWALILLRSKFSWQLMVYYLSRQVLILFVLIVYHINTTFSVTCSQFTNVMLLLKNLPIEHFSVPDLSSSVSALRLYLSLQLSGALWALTLTPCKSALFGHGCKRQPVTFPKRHSFIF